MAHNELFLWGGAVEHLIPMLVEYPNITHVSMLKFLDVEDFNKKFKTDIKVIYKDFFELNEELKEIR